MSGPTVTELLAAWVLAFDPGAVAAPTRERLKLSLLDAIGCAYRARASAIAAPVIAAQRRAAGDGPCAIIGAAESVPLPWAVLTNAALVRALDYNDHQALDPNDGVRLGGHPSDVLAVGLAVGELWDSPGREVVDAALIGYEIFGRAQKVLGRDHSWDHVTVHGLTAPAIAGRLSGSSPEMLSDALSLGAAHATTPGVVRRGALSSAKFLAGPMVLHAGVMASLLAASGATGPRTVFEDPEKGLLRQVYGARDLSPLTAPLIGHPMVEGVTIKAYPGLDTAQALISAVVAVRAAHAGSVESIASLTLVLADNPMVRRQADDAALRSPANRETADHSLTYLAAAALLEGGVSEDQYARELWSDPTMRDLMDRVELRVDPRWETQAPDAYPCRAELTTRAGERFERAVTYASGHARNPMDAAGVTAKFRHNVDGLISPSHADEIIAGVLAIDELQSVRELTVALGAERQPRSVSPG